MFHTAYRWTRPTTPRNDLEPIMVTVIDATTGSTMAVQVMMDLGEALSLTRYSVRVGSKVSPPMSLRDTGKVLATLEGK